MSENNIKTIKNVVREEDFRWTADLNRWVLSEWESLRIYCPAAHVSPVWIDINVTSPNSTSSISFLLISKWRLAEQHAYDACHTPSKCYNPSLKWNATPVSRCLISTFLHLRIFIQTAALLLEGIDYCLLFWRETAAESESFPTVILWLSDSYHHRRHTASV